jgi:hypothetical protein
MEGEVALLLPPPQMLKRVVLAGCPGSTTEGWEAGAVSLLGSYGVDLTMRV